MKLRNALKLVFAFIAFAGLVSCGKSDEGAVSQVESNPSTPTDETGETAAAEDARLTAFFEEVFEREVSFSPIFEAQLGRKTGQYGNWDDPSETAAIAENERRRDDLQRLSSEFEYAALSPKAQISYDIFKYSREQAMRNFEFRNSQYIAHHTDSYALYLPVVLQNLHKVDTADDARAYISRLSKAESVLTELAANLDAQTDSGIIAPEFVYEKILADLDKIISDAPIGEGEENAVYADFRNKVESLEIDDEARAGLLADGAAALSGPWKTGYETFAAEVRRAQDLADGNDGVWEHPNGAEYYANRIGHYTTLDLTAEEIHEIGLSEVARIQGEMEEIKQAVEFDGTLQEFFQFIRDDPNNYYPNTDEGREAFLERQRGLVAGIYAKVDTYFNLLPKAELDVRRVEPFRENTAGIAFYNAPSADGSRPGIYYTNLRDMTAVQKYVHTAIGYHESVPGHHFQIALQQEMEDLPSFRKHGGYGAFIEGWALYAELLAKEMGFYQDPYEDLGRLQNEIWRAVRLVVDTGLHSKRWTREEAIDYFLENTPLSVGDATTEIERYIARPGQALGYKIGMLKIQELRANAQTELDDMFDVRTFHDTVLQNGAVPLPILERIVDQYVENAKHPAED